MLSPHSLNKSKQFGGATPYLVVLIFSTGVMIIGSKIAELNVGSDQRLKEKRESYLSAANQRLIEWYSANSILIEKNSSTPTESELLTKIVDQQRYGIRAGFSQQQGLPCSSGSTIDSCVPYRKMAIWLRPQNAAASKSTFSTETGLFTPDAGVKKSGEYRETNTQFLSSLQKAQISDLLTKTANKIQNFSRVQMKVQGGSSFEDFYRSPQCSANDTSYLPCLNAVTPITITSIPQMAGLDPQDYTSFLGDVVQVTNAYDSATQSYPLKLSISSPWATTLSMIVRQPE
jgi:hypothetical protein